MLIALGSRLHTETNVLFVLIILSIVTLFTTYTTSHPSTPTESPVSEQLSATKKNRNKTLATKVTATNRTRVAEISNKATEN